MSRGRRKPADGSDAKDGGAPTKGLEKRGSAGCGGLGGKPRGGGQLERVRDNGEERQRLGCDKFIRVPVRVGGRSQIGIGGRHEAQTAVLGGNACRGLPVRLRASRMGGAAGGQRRFLRSGGFRTVQTALALGEKFAEADALRRQNRKRGYEKRHRRCQTTKDFVLPEDHDARLPTERSL